MVAIAGLLTILEPWNLGTLEPWNFGGRGDMPRDELQTGSIIALYRGRFKAAQRAALVAGYCTRLHLCMAARSMRPASWMTP
jgi:hypothetical protein